jgi:hypothetical protein
MTHSVPANNSLERTRLASGHGFLNSHSHKLRGPPDKSLEGTRLAGGKLECALPAR